MDWSREKKMRTGGSLLPYEMLSELLISGKPQKM